MTQVAVIILNWNGEKLLKEFIPILVKNTPVDVEIVLGDNASTDGSVEWVTGHYPQIRCIVNESNLGYAEGYNQVIKHVQASYYVLLNSDVEVSPNWITPVVEYLESHPNVAAAQPKIRSYIHRDRFEYAGAAGGYMDRMGYFFCRGRLFDSIETDDGQYDTVQEIFWASGAAFFIKSAHFNQAGGFDGSLFAHMEEIDLCWRIQRTGYRIVFIPSSVVYHMGGQTLRLQNAQKTYLNFRNNLLILYKNLDPRHRGLILAGRFCLDFIAWIRFLVLFEFQHALAINQAHIDFLKTHKKYLCRKKSILTNQDRSQNTASLPGYFPKSLVWNFFIKGKKKFSEL